MDETTNTQPTATEPSAALPAADSGTAEVSAEPSSIDEIMSHVDEERRRNNLPDLETSHSVPTYTGPDYWAPVRNAFEGVKNYDWHNFLGDMAGIGQAALYGTGQGLQEMGRTVVDLGDSVNHTLDFIPAIDSSGGSIDGRSGAQIDKETNATNTAFREAIPNFAELMGVPKPDNTIENITATVVPMALSYWMGGKALEGLGVVSKLNGVQIPGIVGQGLARVGINGANVSRSLLAMMKTTAAMGTTLPADSTNFADMLNSFRERNDSIGSISRAWLSGVPGEKWLVHDEDDSPLLKRLKTGLDGAYGEIIGPLAYMTLRLGRIGLMASKGLVESHVLQQAAKEAELTQQVLEKLGNDPSNHEEAMKILYPHQTAEGSTVDASARKTAGEAELSAAGPAPVDEAEVVDNAAEEVADTSGQTPVTPTQSTLPSRSGMSTADKLRDMLTWNPSETTQRISEAKAQVDATARQNLSDLGNFNRRYSTLAKRAGGVVENRAFDSEGYLNHLNESADDPAAFNRALEDWHNFMGEDGPTELLTPRQLGAWKNTPYDVTGNVIDTVKRLTTSNEARRNDAAKFLAKLMGDAGDEDLLKMSKSLLGATAEASGRVNEASRTMLMSGMYLENTVKPGLAKAVRLLSEDENDPEVKQLTVKLLRDAFEHREALKNLKSAAGSLLQGAQIDPELDAVLRETYGPQQYRAYFDPLGARVMDEASQAAEHAALASEGSTAPTALTGADETKINLLKRFLGVTRPDAQIDLAAKIHYGGTHPVWKRLGQGADFMGRLGEQTLMSLMLYHPSTWTRVLSGSTVGTLYDSAAQAIGSRFIKDANMAATMRFGAAWRATSLPYSLMVAGKSFVTPGLNASKAVLSNITKGVGEMADSGLAALGSNSVSDMHNLGSSLYRHDQILGPEMIEGSFGRDVATKVFTGAGGWTGRLLRSVGMGLGFPHHTLGVFETMINHGALSSRLAESLYSGALAQGLKGDAAKKYVFEHISDVMEDAIVANQVPKGQIALRNRVGLDAEQLRNLVAQADNNASYTSLRERGQDALYDGATTKLGDTAIFQAEKGVRNFLTSIPVVGRPLRGAVAPFSNVAANMVFRSISPIQVIMDGASQLLSRGRYGGPSSYIAEALQGLHGPHRQAQLLGHTAIAGALYGLGIANMALLRDSGRTPNYALGPEAQSEAGRDLGVRYGESLLPDGGSVTTMGLNPFITPYNLGNYMEWIRQQYPNASSDPQQAQEATLHYMQTAEVAAPIGPMYQGLGEVFGSLNDNGLGELGSLAGIATGLASSVGNAVKRPLRIPDLAPGAQTPGKTVAVKTGGVRTAFMTSLAGADSRPNINRVNAYDVYGDHVPDKYDPDNSANQFLEALGWPSYRKIDESPYGRFEGELESHGITMDRTPKTLNLSIGGNTGNVPVNLQQFYNPKTKEHLWDVFNRFYREQRTTSWVKRDDPKELSLREAMDQAAEEALKMGDNSSVYRMGTYRRANLDYYANMMKTHMAGMRKQAADELSQYLLLHADDFVDSHGLKLTDYADKMYRSKSPLIEGK